MIEKRPDDSMVEISDIDDEPTTPNPELAPRIVIEYRDRGIPWMLVPPLLALSAVITAVVVYNVNARMHKRRPTVAVVAPAKDLAATEPIAALAPPLTTPLDPVPAVTPEPTTVKNPSNLANPEIAGLTPMVAAPDPSGSNAIANASPPDPEPDSSFFPKVSALGFDPAAINNPVLDRDPAGAAPVDRNLAPVGQPGLSNEPAPNPVGANQPQQVDPDLLPPDPRKARLDRQRRIVEAYRKAETERAQFHADLLAVYRKLKQRSAPSIHALCQSYNSEIPSSALDQAKKALGKTGMYAGASTTTRINLLRKLGFPETAILQSIFDLESRLDESEWGRGAPSKDELYVRSAVILLNHPPHRVTTSARPVLAPRTNIGPQPVPSAAADGSPPDSNR